MSVVIDTNVLIAANGRNCEQATPACQLACIRSLRQAETQSLLIIDDGFHILKQYQKEVSPTGQPGVGDAFLKWVLTNRQNPERCQQVHITPTEDGSFEEFPKTPELRSFDRDEHKFVAVALTHRDRPPILNAVDSDWLHFQSALAAAGVTVKQLCPTTLKANKPERKTGS
ncbi:MAG: hypothetical protein VKJ09_01420 [Leptolyngbya sp.]|nr:hypothetical protein [Leptolyngbya sp.]